MFQSGSGPLYEFLSSIDRDMVDCGGKTPVQIVLQSSLLATGGLLVHMNFLTDEDRTFLRQSAGAYPVVHCPRTHAFFERPPFDLEFFLESGIPVLLGTDSLASNQDLNMFAEMRAMRAAFPRLDPLEILRMATTLPAAAIGWGGRLGELSPGAVADFLAIPDDGELSPGEQVISNKLPPKVWISGLSS